jgi:hypothetical protein
MRTKASEEKTVQITLRVPESWLSRADALAKKLSRPGMPANRADVFRATVATGFPVLEKAKS